jgi:MFS family permease
VKAVNKQKNKWINIKPILLAILGIVLILLYFGLITKSPTLRLLKPRLTKEAILTKAKSFFNQLIADPIRFEREISAHTQQDLFRYAQYYRKLNHHFPDLSIGYWKALWREKQTPAEADQKNSSRGFSISFDFNGNLLGFEIGKKSLIIEGASGFSEEDAELEAKFFLESFNIDTKSLLVTNKDIKKTDDSTTLRFTLKAKKNRLPHLTDTYTFEFLGNRILSYQWDRIVDPEALGRSDNRIEETFAKVSMLISWLTIIALIIVLFFKKLRNDELEFKRALWLGIAAAVLCTIMMAVSQEGTWEGLLLGGILGLICLVGLLILFPVTESCARQYWPEKLEVLDVILRVKGSVREAGAAILHSFFLVGLTVFLFGTMLLLATALDLGYLALPADMIDAFQDLPQAFSFSAETIVTALFLGFTFVGFWPAFLKGKIPNKKRLFIILLTLSYVLAGLQLFYFHPPHLSLVVILPIMLIWGFIVREWDLFTLLLSLLGTVFFLGLMLMPLMPETLFSPQGMAVIIAMALFFLLGVYLVFRPRSAKDYDSYIPEYIRRMAEKERFLKELEIARGVQLRFLPQKTPEFPCLDIVSLCQPAMEVGGDYYDFIRIDDRYMSVLIGDVSGKGVSAAFYMTMVKGIVKTLSKKTKDPATLLSEANDIFFENAPRNVFITIIFGIFDLKEKNLTLARAGHNPLVAWRHRTGKAELIHPRGLGLGLEYGERYKAAMEEILIPIEEKDVFVFYTDGITEAMNIREEIFGEERLLAVIEAYAHLSAQDLQEKILQAVKDFSGKAPQHDDFTMVLIKVRDH